MLATEENDKIFGGGMNKDRDVNFYMTVHVRKNSGKTTSIKGGRRQDIARIMDVVERKTMILKNLHHLANQGKALSDKKTVEESNIEAETTIEMSMRPKGGMKKDEPMAPAEKEEDGKKRKSNELGGDTMTRNSGIVETRLSDDTEYIKKEINNASESSDEKIENSVTNGWLLVSGWSTMKRDTHHVRMAIVVSSS